MKYLKTYENLNEPEIGDYIFMIKKPWKGKSSYEEFDEFVDFLNNNIGVIVGIKDNYGIKVYLVQYDNMPYDINKWLNKKGSRRDGLFYSIPERNTIRITNKDNFVFGKDKDKLKEKRELKKSTDNYNL